MMNNLASRGLVLLFCYAAAWLVAFLVVVGPDPALVVTYFRLGWSFSGLELPTFVWLGAWPVFGLVLLALHLVRRKRRITHRAA